MSAKRETPERAIRAKRDTMRRPRRAFVDLRAALTIFARSRSAVFWTLAFPVLMMLIFGSILSESGSSVKVGVLDDDRSQESRALVDAFVRTGGLNVVNLTSGIDPAAAARDQNLHTVVVVPAGFGAAFARGDAEVRLFQDKSQTNSNIAGSVVRGVIDAFNLRGSPPAITMSETSLVAPRLKFVDFFLPGVIGMTITTTALIGTLEINTKYRVRGILKKLATTPITKLEWVLSKVMYQMILGLITAGTVIVVGILAFDIRIFWNPLAFLILLAGTAAFAGLSLMIARYVREEESANAAGSAIALPMFFLAGTFFPLENMPPFLKAVAQALPLTYVNEGMRAAMITNNESAVILNGAVVGGIAVACVIGGALLTEWKEV